MSYNVSHGFIMIYTGLKLNYEDLQRSTMFSIDLRAILRVDICFCGFAMIYKEQQIKTNRHRLHSIHFTISIIIIEN